MVFLPFQISNCIYDGKPEQNFSFKQPSNEGKHGKMLDVLNF